MQLALGQTRAAWGTSCRATRTGILVPYRLHDTRAGITSLPGLQQSSLPATACQVQPCCAGEVVKVTHGRQCLDGEGQEVPCCAWQPDAWVPAYMSLTSIMLLWTVFLFGQFRIFTISGTVAQWCDPETVAACDCPL